MAYKQFTPDVLSSADVNNYLMKQTVVTFASAAARTTALGATIPEGMVTYLTDTNTFWYYDGSAWTNLGNVMLFASAAARTTALPSPAEGMVSYLQDVDRCEIYNGSGWVRIVNLDSANRFDIPASGIVTTETSTGRGLAIRASSGDTTAPILQFTNNAVSLQYASITATSNGALNMNSSYVLHPNQPRFLVHTGGYNHTGNWVDISTLGGTTNRTVDYNIGSAWNTSTGLFTAPVTGYYLFYAGGWANYNGAGNRYAISFHINANLGGDWTYISGANTSAVDTPLAMSPVVRYMTTGQYMRTTMFSAVAMQLGTSSHKFYYGGYLLG